MGRAWGFLGFGVAEMKTDRLQWVVEDGLYGLRFIVQGFWVCGVKIFLNSEHPFATFLGLS